MGSISHSENQGHFYFGVNSNLLETMFTCFLGKLVKWIDKVNFLDVMILGYNHAQEASKYHKGQATACPASNDLLSLGY